MNKKVFLLLIVFGVLLRLVVATVTFHPDIRAINLGAYLVSQKGLVFSFYDYMYSLPQSNELVSTFGRDIFIYPPLAYLVPGSFMFLLSPFYDFSITNSFLTETSSLFSSFDIFRQLF